MSSAWLSERPKCVISSFLGSSAPRMMRITSSISTRTMRRPSSVWIRASASSKEVWERACTVRSLKLTHSDRMSFKPFWRGLPSIPITTRLNLQEVSRLVLLRIVLTSSSRSMDFDFGSMTKRTGASALDSSLMPLMTFMISCLSCCCFAVKDFLPCGALGLVSASSSDMTFMTETL